RGARRGFADAGWAPGHAGTWRGRALDGHCQTMGGGAWGVNRPLGALAGRKRGRLAPCAISARLGQTGHGVTKMRMMLSYVVGVGVILASCPAHANPIDDCNQNPDVAKQIDGC